MFTGSALHNSYLKAGIIRSVEQDQIVQNSWCDLHSKCMRVNALISPLYCPQVPKAHLITIFKTRFIYIYLSQQLTCDRSCISLMAARFHGGSGKKINSWFGGLPSNPCCHFLFKLRSWSLTLYYTIPTFNDPQDGGF